LKGEQTMTQAQEARLAMRQGTWTGPTVHQVKGYVQANLVVLPRADAYEFLVYCQRNAKACPVIEVADPGDPEPRICAPGADLRTDLPRYAIYKSGTKEGEVRDILKLWTQDSIAFLLGSSLSFDDALARAGVEAGDTVWALNTEIPTVPAGKFHGNLVVTMRLMSHEQVIPATQVSTRYIFTHGSPIHVGNPEVIGADLERPIYGPPLPAIPEGKTAVFWACGVTPQQAAIVSKQELMITHAPGHGFVTDLRSDSFCIP